MVLCVHLQAEGAWELGKAWPRQDWLVSPDRQEPIVKNQLENQVSWELRGKKKATKGLLREL